MEFRWPWVSLCSAGCFHLWSVLSVAWATCPEKALEKAMHCTAGLGIGPPTQYNAFVEQGKIEVAKKACRESTLSKAVTCMENILTACKGSSDREHFLHRMIDPKRSREAVDFFCSHIDAYEKHAPCIARCLPAMALCLEPDQRTMQTKVKATPNMDFLMTSTCKYYDSAEICASRVLVKDCGTEAFDIVSHVFKGFKPPICDSSSGDGSDSDFEGQQTGDGGEGTNRSPMNFTKTHIVLCLLTYVRFTLNCL